MKVRLATARDLPALRRHRDGMFRDMGRGDAASRRKADRAYARWARARLRNGSLVGFVVEERGRVAASGCVWLRPWQPGPAWQAGRLPYLMSMYTEPEFRGRGLATRIVRAATAWCRKAGYPKFLLHASDAGRGVYERLGWKRTWEMETTLREP